MSAPANAAPESEAVPPRRKWLRVPSLGQSAALVGLIGGVVGLLFIFKPGWKPQPPSQVGTVEFSDVHARQPVTFKRYLQRLKLSPGNMSPAMLRRKGVLIEFHAHIVGFRSKELPLRWELNDAASDDLVAQDEAISIEPSTTDEGRTWFVWAPTPKTRRRYYLTVTLYQPPKGKVDVPLGSFDSPTFRGLGRK
jgi:hypothetical protein